MLEKNRDTEDFIAIYSLLFLGFNLRFVLRDGNNPYFCNPLIEDGKSDYPWGEVIDVSGNREEWKTISLFVGKDADNEGHNVWKPKSRLMRMLQWYFPLVYEGLRHCGITFAARHLVKAELADIPPSDPISEVSRDFSAEPPAVLIGMYWLEPGGAEKLAIDCIRYALDAGFRVYVVASEPAKQTLSDQILALGDVHFIRLDRYLAWDQWAAFLINFIPLKNIRFLHIHHCEPLYRALPTVKAAYPELKVFDSVHIREHLGGGFVSFASRYSRFIDTHHVISRQLADLLPDRKKVVLGRMVEPEARLPFRMVSGTSSLRVIWVGRMAYQKRPVVVAAVFQALARWSKSKGVTIAFDCVGSGPMKPAMQRAVRRFGVNELVTFHEHDADVIGLMRAADLLVLPSANEGLALVCFESVMVGTIPISTDVGAQSELVPSSLLVAASPKQSIDGIVRIVDALWSSSNFLNDIKNELDYKLQEVLADDRAGLQIPALYQAVPKN